MLHYSVFLTTISSPPSDSTSTSSKESSPSSVDGSPRSVWMGSLASASIRVVVFGVRPPKTFDAKSEMRRPVLEKMLPSFASRVAATCVTGMSLVLLLISRDSPSRDLSSLFDSVSVSPGICRTPSVGSSAAVLDGPQSGLRLLSVSQQRTEQ